MTDMTSDTTHNLTIERLAALPVGGLDSEVWEVGIVPLPTLVQEETDAAPWQPVCCVCVSSEGGVMMTPPTRPNALADSSPLDALALFALERHVPQRPPLGYLPSMVHIVRMEGARGEHFRHALGRLGIAVEVKEQLPNLDEFLKHVEAAVGDAMPIEAPPLISAKGMCVERIRAFAEAADLFYRAEPWTCFPRETAWIIEPKPRTSALRTCLVMGSGGEEFGLAFLKSPSELYRMVSAGSDFEQARPSGTVWSMTYLPILDAIEDDGQLWLKENLPIADENAFPFPMGLTEAGKVRRPTPEQMNLMEALLRGFATVEADAGDREIIEFNVETFDGPTSLVLRCGARL